MVTTSSLSSVIQALYPTPQTTALAAPDTSADTKKSAAASSPASATSDASSLSLLPLSLLAPSVVSLLLETLSFGSSYPSSTGATYALTAYAAANALDSENFETAGASLLLQGDAITADDDVPLENASSAAASQSGGTSTTTAESQLTTSDNILLDILGVGVDGADPSLAYLTTPPSLFQTLELRA